MKVFIKFSKIPMKTSIAILIVISTISFPLFLFAQEGFEHLSVNAHGSGRTYVVTSRGLSSVGLNPSLLGIENDKNFELQIFPVSSFGLDAGASFSDASALSGVFSTNISKFTDSSRKSITDLLSNGKLSGRGDAEIIGILYKLPAIGTFAFTWTTHAAVRTLIPQSFLDFLSGAESNLIQSSNSIDNFDLQGMWYSEYAVSFGKNIDLGGADSSTFLKSIAIGGALKYVSGIAYLKVDQGNYIHTTPGNGRTYIAANFVERSAYSGNFDPNKVPNHFSFGFLTSNQAGSGIGFDLGVTLGFFSNKRGAPIVRLGLSATDIGTVTWSKNASERIADHLYDSIVYQNATKIQDLTDSLKKFAGTVTNLSSFSTSLPSMFRAGLQLDLDAMGVEWGSFSPKIAIEYANGLTGLVGSLKNGRLGMGLSLENSGPLRLRLNTGFVLEQDANDITFGVGITSFNFLSIDLASAHVGQFFKSGSKRTDVALALRAAF